MGIKLRSSGLDTKPLSAVPPCWSSCPALGTSLHSHTLRAAGTVQRTPTDSPMAQSHPHFPGLEAHLIVVPEVADPHVLIHVGMVKVLTQPADVTPIEIPFTFTMVRETGIRPEDRGTAGGWGWSGPRWLASLRHQQMLTPRAQSAFWYF